MGFRNNYYRKIGIIPTNTSKISLYSMYNMKQKEIEYLSMHNGSNFTNNKINFRLNQNEFKFNLENYFKNKIYQKHVFSNHVGMFILDLRDDLYLAPSIHVSCRNKPTGHIDLSLGADCLCAGTLHFNEDGILSEIAFDSGHYMPTYQHGMYFLNFLFKKYIQSTSVLPNQGLIFFKKFNIEFFYKNNDNTIKNAFQKLNTPASRSVKSAPIAINVNPSNGKDFASKTLPFIDFVNLIRFL